MDALIAVGKYDALMFTPNGPGGIFGLYVNPGSSLTQVLLNEFVCVRVLSLPHRTPCHSADAAPLHAGLHPGHRGLCVHGLLEPPLDADDDAVAHRALLVRVSPASSGTALTLFARTAA